LEALVAKLQRQVFGAKSERMPEPAQRMPTVQHQLRQQESPEQTATRVQQSQQKRRERAALKAERAPTRRILHPVPQPQRQCPACGSRELKPLGQGRLTVVYEYLPARLERQEHVQEVLSCECGKGVVSAPPPPKVVDKSEYGPGLMAHLITSKCADAMPLHRLARRLERGGVPMSRSTLTDLFHRSAELLAPLVLALLLYIGDDLREARDFDRGERDRPYPRDASSPCQFEALPRQTNRSHADRWPAFPGDCFHSCRTGRASTRSCAASMAATGAGPRAPTFAFAAWLPP
jgi:transposase